MYSTIDSAEFQKASFRQPDMISKSLSTLELYDVKYHLFPPIEVVHLQCYIVIYCLEHILQICPHLPVLKRVIIQGTSSC